MNREFHVRVATQEGEAPRPFVIEVWERDDWRAHLCDPPWSQPHKPVLEIPCDDPDTAAWIAEKLRSIHEKIRARDTERGEPCAHITS